MYKIKVTGAKAKDAFRLGEKYRKLSERGKIKVAKELEDLLVKNIETYKLVWRSNLVDSVEARPLTQEEMEISLSFYAWMIEKGHRIPAGVNLPMLTRWAREKMGDIRGNAWIAKVKKEGHVVLAKPFITDSFVQLKPQIIPIYKREFNASK